MSRRSETLILLSLFGPTTAEAGDTKMLFGTAVTNDTTVSAETPLMVALTRADTGAVGATRSMTARLLPSTEIDSLVDPRLNVAPVAVKLTERGAASSLATVAVTGTRVAPS